MRTTVLSLMLILCLALSLNSCDDGPGGKGGTLGEITLADLEGNSVSLSDYEGRVVMVNFWATWCPPCRQEIPDFIELQNEFEDEGLTILGISLDTTGKNEVASFSRAHKINYPVLYAGGKSQAIMNQVGGVKGIPTTFLLDREGRVAKKVVGLASKSTWSKAIKDLL